MTAKEKIEQLIRSKDTASISIGLYLAKSQRISGLNLRNVNLDGLDLRDMVLKRTDLAGANLRNVNLRGANLMGATLLKTRPSRG